MIRTETQNTYEKHKREAILDDVREFESIGYNIEYITRVMNKIGRREGWQERMKKIRNELKESREYY